MEHPHQDAVERLSALILYADPGVHTSTKWNAPSFALGDDHFATFQLRAKQGLMLVMHFGAKKREVLPQRTDIADPAGMLTWLADDRAVIKFDDLADVEARSEAFVALVRAWVGAMPR